MSSFRVFLLTLWNHLVWTSYVYIASTLQPAEKLIPHVSYVLHIVENIHIFIGKSLVINWFLEKNCYTT